MRMGLGATTVEMTSGFVIRRVWCPGHRARGSHGTACRCPGSESCDGCPHLLLLPPILSPAPSSRSYSGLPFAGVGSTLRSITCPLAWRAQRRSHSRPVARAHLLELEISRIVPSRAGLASSRARRQGLPASRALSRSVGLKRSAPDTRPRS